jgi:hypothetical protein
LQPGDRVVHKLDPLRYGYGTIEHILTDGTHRVTVRFEGGDLRPMHPQYLEHAATWEQQAEGAFTNHDLLRLTRPASP